MKKAFIDPVTNVLKCHGYIDKNHDGDVEIAVSDEFSLEPEKFRYINGEFVEYQKPMSYQEARLNEYNKRGATIDALVIAMFENNQTDIQRLQQIRNQVKAEIPKKVQ